MTTPAVPLPPDDLMRLVSGHADRQAFDVSRVHSVDKLLGFLSDAGVDHARFGRVLDFGCGCGRVVAGWVLKQLDVELHGCDINRDLIAWCRANIPKGEYAVVGLDPPTPYPDEFFDFVYGVSVFTHLGLGRQKAWAREMVRILRPGGHLFVTFHGAYYHETFFKQVPHGREVFERDGYLTVAESEEGSNRCAVLHDPAFLARLFRPLRLMKHIEGPTHIGAHQDACLFHKADRPAGDG
jgi:SAM-dependent methyltransferase